MLKLHIFNIGIAIPYLVILYVSERKDWNFMVKGHSEGPSGGGSLAKQYIVGL